VYTLNNRVVTATSAAGTYTASVTVGEAVASTTFTVTARPGTGGGGGYRRPSGGGSSVVVNPDPGENGGVIDIQDPDVPLADIDDVIGGTVDKFIDVQKSGWYYDNVGYAYDKKLMNGVSDNVFGVNDATTRGMIVTILYRLEGEPEAGTAGFADIQQEQYYTKAVAWAAENGIVTGYDSTTFAPSNNITREQLAAILYRYAAYKGCDVTNRADLSGYADVTQVSGYAVEAMQWAVAEKLISGMTETTLVSGGNAVRAQVAAILARFCQNVAK